MRGEMSVAEGYEILDEGSQAYCRKGLVAMDNPYALGTVQANTWRIGWEEAKRMRHVIESGIASAPY